MTDTDPRKLVQKPFKPSPDLQQVPAIREGYVIQGGPVKWVAYKPQGAKQMKRKGRWKAMNEYGGWDNCETPAEVWPHFIDYRALLAETDALRASLRQCMARLESIARSEFDGVWTEDDFANLLAPYRAALGVVL